MRHLTLEALARLVDEAPQSQEQAHLAACGGCREELEALRAQTEALRMLPSVLPPPDSWPALSRRMRAEGIIRGGGRPAMTRRPAPALTRIAAALTLFAAGAAAGYAVRGPLVGDAAQVVARADDARSGQGGGDVPAGHGAQGPGGATEGTDPGTLSSYPGGATETAGEEVERTDAMFAAALDRFMRASGTPAPDPAARLAALDNIVLTTAEALNESPSDPVINSYHVTAVAQRRELIRQLTSSGDPVF